MNSTKVFRRVRSAAVAAAALCAGAVPALAQNWEGPHQVRFGAYLLEGGNRMNGSTPSASDSAAYTAKGIGMSAGVEWLRVGRFTWGVESDLGINDGSKAILGAKFGTDYFASLRGRAGFYVHPDWVIYGTGGLGFQGVVVDQGGGAKVQKTLVGGVFGGGTEWHRGGTILFAEYLHGDYSGHDVTINNSSTFTTTNYHVDARTDTVRLGVKFKVGYDGYYDDVRDGLRR